MTHTAGVTANKSPTVSYGVFDAIEGRAYATYIWINTQNRKFWEVPPTLCEVHPRGMDKIQCKDDDEFASLVDKYFGIGIE